MQLKRQKLDLIGDFGGSELFVIEGDGLLFHFASDPAIHLLNLNRTPNSAHALYAQDHSVVLVMVWLVERFLDALIQRGAVFQIIFFETHAHIWQSDYRLLTVREAVIKHLSTISLLKPVLRMASPNASTWDLYLEDENPLFVLMNDGTMIDSAQDAMYILFSSLALHRKLVPSYLVIRGHLLPGSTFYMTVLSAALIVLF